MPKVGPRPDALIPSYRWWDFAGLTWSLGQVAKGHRSLFRTSAGQGFAGIEVCGWHLGACR